VDKERLMKVLERHIGDKKMLHLIDCSLGDCNELLIGRYISQLLINPFITPLDRFIKEELKARHCERPGCRDTTYDTARNRR
jgi:hypothetical protein